MDNDENPARETEAVERDERSSRREVLQKAGPAAYVAPGLMLLALSPKVQLGSPPAPPG